MFEGFRVWAGWEFRAASSFGCSDRDVMCEVNLLVFPSATEVKGHLFVCLNLPLLQHIIKARRTAQTCA